MSRKLIVILGPTAVGKTSYAISKALEEGSPVISCDSRQIFREMRIGTAVPSPEELAAVKHYFIQTESVTSNYTAGKYEEDALALSGGLFAAGHETLVMCGGSMMYIDAVCEGFDSIPSAAPGVRESLMEMLSEEGVGALAERLRELDPETWERVDRNNPHRLVRALEVCITTGRPYSSFRKGRKAERDFEIEKVGLTMPREKLYKRIDARVDRMIGEGLVDEVRSLLPYRNLPALRTVGYQEIFPYLDGEISLDEAVSLVKRNSRRYAKRQMTWWRRDESINWIDAESL